MRHAPGCSTHLSCCRKGHVARHTDSFPQILQTQLYLRRKGGSTRTKYKRAHEKICAPTYHARVCVSVQKHFDEHAILLQQRCVQAMKHYRWYTVAASKLAVQGGNTEKKKVSVCTKTRQKNGGCKQKHQIPGHGNRNAGSAGMTPAVYCTLLQRCRLLRLRSLRSALINQKTSPQQSLLRVNTTKAVTPQ